MNLYKKIKRWGKLHALLVNSLRKKKPHYEYGKQYKKKKKNLMIMRRDRLCKILLVIFFYLRTCARIVHRFSHEIIRLISMDRKIRFIDFSLNFIIEKSATRNQQRNNIVQRMAYAGRQAWRKFFKILQSTTNLVHLVLILFKFSPKVVSILSFIR